MKNLLVLAAFLTLPIVSFADTTFCYKAQSAVPAGVSKVLCLENIYSSSLSDILGVESTDKSFPSTLFVTSSIYHTEDRIIFNAEKVLVNVWQGGCGEGLTAKLKVKGNLDIGYISAEALDISMDIEETNDTCHSRPQLSSVKYLLVE